MKKKILSSTSLIVLQNNPHAILNFLETERSQDKLPSGINNDQM